jgi:hypothetical protein
MRTPNLLFRWRKDLGEVRQTVAEHPAFVPVVLSAVAASSALQASTKGSQIELAGEHRLRVDGSVDADALRRVIDVSAVLSSVCFTIGRTWRSSRSPPGLSSPRCHCLHLPPEHNTVRATKGPPPSGGLQFQ